MPTGGNPGDLPLWKLRLKINTPDGGLNSSFWCALKIEADARAACIDLGNRILAIMPSTCEIFSAVMSKDTTKKDGRVIPDIIADGRYGQGGVDPEPTTYNRYDDAFLIRIENNDGGWMDYKHGPIPDGEIVAGEAPNAPDSVVGVPAGALPAIAAQPVVFKTELNNLMKALVKNFTHIQTKGHTPGGTYTYFLFENAHYERVTKKKGGRVFTK